jgi:hypothetical protein
MEKPKPLNLILKFKLKILDINLDPKRQTQKLMFKLKTRKLKPNCKPYT